MPTDTTQAAFRLIDDLRERGMRLSEACAHASVDTNYPGDWRDLSDAYAQAKNSQQGGSLAQRSDVRRYVRYAVRSAEGQDPRSTNRAES